MHARKKAFNHLRAFTDFPLAYAQWLGMHLLRKSKNLKLLRHGNYCLDMFLCGTPYFSRNLLENLQLSAYFWSKMAKISIFCHPSVLYLKRVLFPLFILPGF